MFTFGVLTILVAGFTQETGGNLLFTKEPPKTVYVKVGNDLVLVWKYYNVTKPADLSFLSWDVNVKGVSWKKIKEENFDGTLIDSSQQPARYKNRTEKSSQATLVIRNMTVDDSTEYRCVLTNKVGTRTESVTNVIVTGPAVCKPGIQIVAQGTSATIACNATNVPREYMTCITGLRGSEKNENCSQFAFKDVSLSDGGYYRCNATINVNEPNVDVCYLQVIDPLKTDDAYCPSVSHIGRIGQNLSICCPVSSYPPPDITWKKGSQLQQGRGTVLTISLDKDDRFGNYTCAATDGKTSIGPIVITISKDIATLPPPINVTDAKTAKVEWTRDPLAKYYVTNIRGRNDDILSDVLVGTQTSFEIHYHTLVQKQADKKPEKIEVCVVVSAVRDTGIFPKVSTCLAVRSHQMTLQADIACLLIVLIISLVW